MAQGAWGGWTVARHERFWSGAEVFTESFHDFSPPDFRVDYYRTFVYANGDVRVDREIIRNPPPSCD